MLFRSTGKVAYSHVGVFFPNVIGSAGVMPYLSATLSWYDRLDKRLTDVFNVGCSLLLDGFHSRITLDVQNRPTYGISTMNSSYGELVEGARKSQVTLQYQVVW